MTQARTGPRPGRWLRALRAFSFPLSALPVWIATAAAAAPSAWQWDVVAACTLLVLALHSAGNLLNDFFDYTSGADSRSAGDQGRPGRLLVRGEMTPGQVLAGGVVSFGVGAAVTGYLLWRRGPALLWFVAPAMLALYAYTGPPFVLKRRALGEALVFIVFGPLVMAGAAYAQTGTLRGEILLLSIAVGMVPASVLAGNNLRDYEEDGAAGVVTLARLIGPRGQRAIYTALVVGQAVGVGLFGVLVADHAPLAAAPAFLLLIGGTLRRTWRGERIPDIDVRTARYGTALMLFLLVVLCLGGG